MSYLNKDLVKFTPCTHLITRGVVGSSSHKYALSTEWLINHGIYTSEDIVGVSVNGNRRNRIRFDKQELALACKAGATIITDNMYNSSRSYNIGEREVAAFLRSSGYTLVDSTARGTWYPSEDLRLIAEAQDIADTMEISVP